MLREFVNYDSQVIYLDGNSLGRLPVGAVDGVREVLEQQWGGELVEGWEHWLTLQTQDGSVELRLDKRNYKAILERLRTHLGEQKVKTSVEAKEGLLEPLPRSRELAGAIGRGFTSPVAPV